MGEAADCRGSLMKDLETVWRTVYSGSDEVSIRGKTVPYVYTWQPTGTTERKYSHSELYRVLDSGMPRGS